MIQFNCPNCKRLLETPDGTIGSKFACPICAQRIEVPAPPGSSKTVLGKLPTDTPVASDPKPFYVKYDEPSPQEEPRRERHRRPDEEEDRQRRSQRRPDRYDDEEEERRTRGRRRADDDWDRNRRRRRSDPFVCEYCESTELPIEKEKISPEGWTIFAVMLGGGIVVGLCGGVLCFPLIIFLLAPVLCWLPLLLMKKKEQICYDCGRKVA